ncbi:MAG: hypothetical protein R2712_27965 [Vicinamibacterales bacterium]
MRQITVLAVAAVSGGRPRPGADATDEDGPKHAPWSSQTLPGPHTCRGRRDRDGEGGGLGAGRQPGRPERKGLLEPVPVDGYAFTLKVDGRQVEHHTDRQGRIGRAPRAAARPALARARPGGVVSPARSAHPGPLL